MDKNDFRIFRVFYRDGFHRLLLADDMLHAKELATEHVGGYNTSIQYIEEVKGQYVSTPQ